MDPRVPTLRDHLKCLQEEILVEEEEAREEDKILVCAVEEGRHTPHGSEVRVQVMQGDPRWVVKGSRLEGRHADQKVSEKNATMARVEKKAGPVLQLQVDDPAWADVPRGHQVALQPQTNATLYRNLLKAFIVVTRFGPDDLLKPESLPPLKPAAAKTDGLRPKQAEALEKAVGLEPGGTMLVQGPPGTGKTFVIARLISEAVRAGKTVLVTSHTHVAIDNALRKAVKGDRALRDKMVRLGEAKAVSADLLPWNASISKFHMDPDDEDALPLFSSITKDRPVVGMTLDALACAFVHADKMDQPVEPFDLVIVDEAGMNAYPKLAIANAAGKRLVLVGDPLQLPPIIRAWSYRDDQHYKRSHFEILQLLRPDLCVMLDEQFRCHPDVYEWSNGAVYGGDVTSRNSSDGLAWNGAGPVVWLDTQELADDKTERIGSSRINPRRMELAMDLFRQLIKSGIPPEEIGYITPFRAQADGLRERLAEQKDANVLVRVTAATVDAFQGNERRAIIFDLTTRRPGKPHEDHRRLNVSLTRAQDLLIIIGPRNFVRKSADNPFYASLQQWQAPAVVPA